MKQIIQSYKTGEVRLKEVPVPRCGSNRILVQNVHSLVSIGTERSTIELGRKSLLGKAQARPDLVRRAWEKARKEGLLKTYQEAMGRLDTPTPLGYSCTGIVVEVGDAATAFVPGDRVACIGQGFASHAEFVSVPVNLACKIPDGLPDESGAFGMLGIIALHGIRCANLTFGSNVAVIGLGLLGLLSIQMLRAYGCNVFAMDLDEHKVELAKELGFSATSNAEELQNQVQAGTHADGVDAVIITAASKSADPVDLSIKLSRFKGKIVLVGTADVHPDRNELWLKEVEFVVSKAAGAGSLDPLYELEGVDLPIGEVRWTQNRNLAEFLRLMQINAVQIKPLTTHRFSIQDSEKAYKQIIAGELKNSVGVLLDYEKNPAHSRHVQFAGFQARPVSKKEVRLGVIGAGLFGKALLLPALSKLPKVNLHTLVTSSGVTAEHSAHKFSFVQCATDAQVIWEDNSLAGVVGITPHSTHAPIVQKALEHKKALFLEKPLCVTPEELEMLTELFETTTDAPLIMIGHNRRFSPHAKQMKKWLAGRNNPLVMQMRINSGFIPGDHWVHSESEGRSRVIGEMSHFIDLMQMLTQSLPTQVHAERVSGDNRSIVNNDNVVIVLKFADGSVASLMYSASGDKGYSREMMELFFDGKTIVSRDFSLTELHGTGKTQKLKTSGQEMGYNEELQHFIACLKGKELPAVSAQEMLCTMKTLFAIESSLATGNSVKI